MYRTLALHFSYTFWSLYIQEEEEEKEEGEQRYDRRNGTHSVSPE